MSRISDIDKYLMKGLVSSFPTDGDVDDAAKYLTQQPGRRFRPIVALSTYKMLGGKGPRFLKAATGIEYLHLASLPIDDSPTFDGATERKGGLPIHLQYGPEVAALLPHHLRGVGERLIRRCLNEHHRVSVDYRNKVDDLTQSTVSRLIDGQQARSRDRDNTEEEHLLEVAFNLNSLFHYGPVLAGYFRRKNPETIGLLDQIGRAWAKSYQLRDDINDVGEDEKNGRVTLPIIKGVDYTEKKILEGRDIILSYSKQINRNSRPKSLVDEVLGI